MTCSSSQEVLPAARSKGRLCATSINPKLGRPTKTSTNKLGAAGRSGIGEVLYLRVGDVCLHRRPDPGVGQILR